MTDNPTAIIDTTAPANAMPNTQIGAMPSSCATVDQSALTPMLQHFVKVKLDHPDALVFYRMGDFYELFFEDAITASQALDITLTSRGKHKDEPIPMAGVPVRAAQSYLHRLIDQGFKVAICEQMEDPAEAKKRGAKAVVERKVIRIITPATITEENLLEPQQANRLLALTSQRRGQEWGLASIDLSTGEFFVKFTNEVRLFDEIALLSPSEIIASDIDLQTASVLDLQQQENVKIGSAGLANASVQNGKRRLKQLYGEAGIIALEKAPNAIFAACDTLLNYVDHTQQEQFKPIKPPTYWRNDSSMTIDAATRFSLEIDLTTSGKKEGSLFQAVNRTLSAPGARLLRSRLNSPSRDIALINSWFDIIDEFRNREPCLHLVREQLKTLPDFSRAVTRFALGRWGPRDFILLRNALKATIEIAKVIENSEQDHTGLISIDERSVLATKFAVALNLSTELRQLCENLFNAISDQPPLTKNEGGSLKPGYDETFDRFENLRSDARKEMTDLQLRYANETQIVGLKVKFNNVLGYFVEVTNRNADALRAHTGPTEFLHRQTLATCARFKTQTLSNLEEEIENAGRRALELELSILDQFAEKILEKRDELLDIADQLAELDVAAANAFWAIENQAVRPELTQDPILTAERLRHPTVEHALKKQGESFTPNHVQLSARSNFLLESQAQQDHENSQIDLPLTAMLVITGPNMAGKSTYLRQTALFTILAQAGCFVPAEQAKLGIVDQLFSRVGASDDLAHGRSTFMTEMVETATILNRATAQSLVIMDEVGRGTATFDGMAIAWAVAEYLHDEIGCRSMFATHYHELAQLAETLPQANNAHLRAREWKDELIFLHEVSNGPADKSYGVQVAKLAGLPTTALRRATVILKQLETQKYNASLNLSQSQDEIASLPLFDHLQPSKSQNESDTTSESDSRADILEQDIISNEEQRSWERLKQILSEKNPNDLTPREALDLVYEIYDKFEKR